MISDQFLQHIEDAHPLLAKELKPGDGYRDLYCTDFGLHKRYSNTHKDTGFNNTPLLHRILFGTHSLEEFAYFLEKTPQIDTMEEYDYVRPGYTHYQDERYRMTSTSSLVKIAQSVKDYRALGLLLCHTKDRSALDEAIKSPPESKCLPIYLETKCKQLGIDTNMALQTINTINGLLDKDYPKLASKHHNIRSLSELCERLQSQEDIYLNQTLKLIIKKGPVTLQNLDDYLNAISEEAQAEQSYEPTLFKTKGAGPSIPPLDMDEARAKLLALCDDPFHELKGKTIPSPPIHYLWVGPKPLDEKAGQDTIGPDLMREKYPDDNQPIFFWCLDSEVEKYKTHFHTTHQGRAPIIVRGIESYLSQLPPIPNPHKKVVEDPEDLTEAFKKLVTTLKIRADAFPDQKDKIREWITIKEAFEFFIQLKEEGYVMDSNAIPEPYYELEEKDSPL